MKVLLSPSSFGQCGSEPLDILASKKFNLIQNPYGRKLTEDEIISLAPDCDGIIAGVEPITKKVMDALPKLKCISRVGVGMDNIDLEYAETKGIKVVNTPDGPTLSVAELSVGAAFTLLRNISLADSCLKNRQWKKFTGHLLSGKIIGIIGLGRIGKKVAEMYRALGNTVYGYDITPDTNWTNKYSVTLCNLDELMASADIISLHIPPKKDKSSVISEKEISLMKKSAYLINMSRGGIVDENAMYQALKNKRIAGAAIDVFVEEPYNGPICELENTVLTPHIGSYAEEGKLKMEIDAVLNLIKNL